MTSPRKEVAFEFSRNPFLRKVVFQHKEPGRYFYLEFWRFTKKRVRRMCLWDGSAWVKVPDSVLDIEPKHMELFRSYSEILHIDLDSLLNEQIHTANKETGDV